MKDLRVCAFLLSLTASCWPGLAQAAESGGMYSAYRDDSAVVKNRVFGEDGALTTAQLMPALVDALDQLSKYPRPPQLPALLRVSRAQLETVACAGKKCGVLAIYRPEAGIYMDEHLHPETNLFDRSVLLHELVHYVQELHGERSDMRPCDRWYYREIEAYAIQKQFLMMIGSPVRVAYSTSRSVCAGEDESPAAAATQRSPSR